MRSTSWGTSTRRRAVGALVGLTASVQLFLVAWLVLTHGHYVGDDLLGFWYARKQSMGAYLFNPINVHVVPLHRLASFVVDGVAPMKFPIAVLCLLLFHALGVVYLHRTLQLLQRSWVNLVFVAAYATHVYVGVLLMWWSSGLHRLPYIALSIMAIYYWVRHLKLGQRQSLYGVAACFVAAFGFYPKAMLIPLYLAAVTVSLASPGYRLRPRGAWLLVVGGLVSLAYTAAVGHHAGEYATRVHLSLAFQLEFQRLSWSVLIESTMGRVLGTVQGISLGLWLCWAAIVALTVALRPRNAIVWLAALVTISTNIAVLGLSDRAAAYGHFVAFAYRYYFELLFLLVLFLAMAVQATIPRLTAIWRPPEFAPRVLAAVLVLGVAASSYEQFASLVDSRFPASAVARRYFANLETDLRLLEAQPPARRTFVDGFMPIEIMPLGTWNRSHQVLFELFRVDVAYGPPARGSYLIGNDGRISELQ